MRRGLLIALAALATAAPAAALTPIPTPPNFPSGSSIGEGVPLKAYASVTPTVQPSASMVQKRSQASANRAALNEE